MKPLSSIKVIELARILAGQVQRMSSQALSQL